MANERRRPIKQQLATRLTYEEYVERRVTTLLGSRQVREEIAHKINVRLKKEIDAIITMGARKRLADMLPFPKPNGPAAAKILAAVAAATGYSVWDLTGPRRSRHVARARLIAYWLFKSQRPDMSLPAIGRAMGNRDHTTIMHGIKMWPTFSEQQPIRDWMLHPAIENLLHGGGPDIALQREAA